MHSLHKPFSIIALLFLLSAGCTHTGNTLRIDHINFTDEIATDQNLSFTFASDLAPDSLHQQWDTTRFISFSPAVKGKFKWNSSRELTFSPSEPFAPSTDFTATLTSDLFKHSVKAGTLPKEKTIKFHTPYLLLGGVQTFWSVSQKNPGAVEVRMNITFNCKVNPGDLKKKLHLLVSGKEVLFDMLEGNPDYSIGVAIADVRGDKREMIPLTIKIDPGLGCLGSTYTTKERMEFSEQVPAKEEIMIVQMNPNFIDGEATINVFTNQPVTNENISSIVTVNPEVALTAEKLDNGFTLKGDFEADKSYTVTISRELKGIFGLTAGKDYIQNVSFGALEPMIAFANVRGMYLSSRGARNIAIKIASVSKIKVSVVRIYENNILNFLRSEEQWGYYEEELGSGKYDYHEYGYYAYDHYGDVVSEKKYNVQSLPKQGNVRLLNLDLEDLSYSDQFKGMYLLRIEDEERLWLQQSKFVSLSDIGLIVRQGSDKIYVFVNSILTSDPQQDVKVNFISANNQTVSTCTTDNNGVAVLDNAKATLGKFRLGMITCTQGDDFNFMMLDHASVETSRFDVAGKYMNDAHLDAFIYGDREIYRPGDSVHVNTILRTDDWKILKDIPMKIKLLLPSGKEFQSFKKSTDAQGSFETSFYLPPSIITGTFMLEVFSGNDVLINSRAISVEEFVPDRIKIVTRLDKQTAKSGEKVRADIIAANLFGPPAAGRNYEVEMQLNRKGFSSKKYPDYNFSIKTADQLALKNILRSGKTDENGKASESFDLPEFTDAGILSGNIFTTVFDESGRPVHQISGFTVNTQEVFYGIKYIDEWVSTKQPLSFQFIACNAAGSAIQASATVEIYRYEWENLIQQAGGRYRYHSQRKDRLVSKQNISLDASGGSISFTPFNSGQYEVRISRPGAETYVAITFYAYGWGDTQNTSFEVSNEGEVDIQLDKENYSIGDKALVLLKSPFECKILVTVERGDVYEYYYVNTDKKAASLTIPVRKDFLPNIYISATAIRKLSGNQLPLTVARGYVVLKVSDENAKLKVAITSAETSRSKMKQRISVKTAPHAELTIAVVDEGILQLKDTKTPDPYNYFYQQRALQVRAFDLYPFLFPEYAASYTSALGGDMAEMLKNRTNPFTTKRFNLVAMWSGILKADAGGNAVFDISVPQFSGAMRVMAVAYKDDAFGSAEKMIRVADPVVISTALPRFLSPGDTVKVPVTLSNTTASTAEVKAEISVSGKVSLASAKSQTLSIKPNGEARAEFVVIADNAIGEAMVTISASSMGEKFLDVTSIAVRPASTLTRRTGSGMIPGGQSKAVSLTANMFPGTMDASLVISKSPMTEFIRDLRYLIQYPYGCVEQTVSAAFPQLYYRDLAKSIGQEGKATVINPEYNVQQAIRKIESMQLYNGALSFWPGGDYESWWGTAYATHFLFEARKAGFDVNDQVLNKCYKYLQQKIKERATEEWYYWDENEIARNVTVWSRSTFYSMFVLALAGKYDQAALNYYKAKNEMLTPDSKYMLAATFYLAGNANSFRQMLPDGWANVRSQRAFGGSFYSDVRDQAIALYVMLEADPDNQQVGIMSRHLSEQMRKAKWLSTQDAAFSFISLGKIARKANESNISATVNVNGKVIGNFSGNDLKVSKGIANQQVTIQTSGSGSVYYFWEVSGIDISEKIKEEDSHLKVRKQFYDRSGKMISPSSINQNDLLVVRITLSVSEYNSSVENVAATDLLPAGFEIENPRISAVPDLNWIKDAAPYDYMDIRDDRITFFCTATASPKNFYYVVRAVSKGLYHMGPVSADAMYNAEYHSYWGAGKVVVR